MRERERTLHYYLRCVSVGAIATVAVVAILFLFSGGSIVLGEMLLYETLPFYEPSDEIAELFRLAPAGEEQVVAYEDTFIAIGAEPPNEMPEAEPSEEISLRIYTGDISEADGGPQTSGGITVEKIFRDYNSSDVVGTGGVTLQPASGSVTAEDEVKPNITRDDIDQLRDIEYLRRNFYIVNADTVMTEEDFDIDYFLGADLSIDTSDGLPKVLIVHTHAYEGFADSEPGNLYDGVVGLGERLAEILFDKYGIICVHNTTRYDLVDGKTQILGAYERIEPDIKKILEQYPSIEIVIDLHRDGIEDESVRLVTEINGKPTAKIMFFNGMSRLYENGKSSKISYLPNPYLKDNLAFSFNLQLAANELYPDFSRKIYLRAHRYTLHMRGKSTLVEVGAQNNTKEEAFNAMEPLADVIAGVVLKK